MQSLAPVPRDGAAIHSFEFGGFSDPIPRNGSLTRSEPSTQMEISCARRRTLIWRWTRRPSMRMTQFIVSAALLAMTACAAGQDREMAPGQTATRSPQRSAVWWMGAISSAPARRRSIQGCRANLPRLSRWRCPSRTNKSKPGASNRAKCAPRAPACSAPTRDWRLAAMTKASRCRGGTC